MKRWTDGEFEEAFRACDAAGCEEDTLCATCMDDLELAFRQEREDRTRLLQFLTTARADGAADMEALEALLTELRVRDAQGPPIKRLSPDEIQAHYRTRKPLDRIGLDLREDHFQAREDVKWLAGQLRRLMCSDPTCTACVEDRARLAEVES